MSKQEYRMTTLRICVDVPILDEIRKLARKEKRSVSNMANVLLGEALYNRTAHELKQQAVPHG